MKNPLEERIRDWSSRQDAKDFGSDVAQLAIEIAATACGKVLSDETLVALARTAVGLAERGHQWQPRSEKDDKG